MFALSDKKQKMAVYLGEEEAAIARSLSDISLSNDTSVTVVIVENKELRCRTALLVDHAKYFKALFAFQNGTKQMSPLTNHVKLMGGIDYESARVILTGLESGVIEVNEDNVQGVLLASTFLQCFRAERVAADFILSKLVLANSFSIFLLAINCGSTYLAEATEDFIVKRIQTFKSRVHLIIDDLLQLDVDDLRLLLDEISDNYVAFIVVCGWILFDISSRCDYLTPLLNSFIIIELIPPDALIVDGLEDQPGILEAIQTSAEYDSLPLRGKINFWESRLSFFNQEDPRPPLNRWPKGAIVCSTGHNTPTVAYRSPTSDGWNKLTVKPAKLKVKSSGSLTVAVGNNLYFIGGVGNVQMWSFNLSQDAWKLLCPEQDERIRPLAVGVDSSIYVFGGYTDRHKEVTYLDTAARFDTLTGTWTFLSPMEYARSGGQACHMGGRIYLFGGLCSRRRAIVSCEVYDIATDTHSPLTNLPSMIIDFGLVYIEPCNTIYIVGGMDPLTFETKNTVYAFDVGTKRWSPHNSIPSLNVARKSCACFFDGSFLYAAGGSTAELEQLNSVERYSPRIGRWEMIESLPKGLSASMCAVVVDLPVRLMDNYRELAQSNVC